MEKEHNEQMGESQAEELITISELARLMNVKHNTILRNHIPNGLPHYRTSPNAGHYRFSWREVKRWMKPNTD